MATEERNQVMKTIFAQTSLVVVAVVAITGLVFAQTTTAVSGAAAFNPPPCDYNDTFYMESGLDPTQIFGRFGTARQNGPPATGKQVNWVADTTCSQRDPDRRNFRVLATTGGFPDDGTGTPTEFISLIGFVTNQTAFETTFSRTVGAINGGLDGDQQNPGETISIVASANPRGISMQNLVLNFEAYPAVKQRSATTGVIALNPCQADMVSPLAPAQPCFDLSSPNAVATPNLRQDWRFATNRNAMDGSDNNCISNDPTVCTQPPFTNPVGTPPPPNRSDSPFGYFCDDILGMWVNTFFWYTVDPADHTSPLGITCTPILKALGEANGYTTDGTPIVKTADELNNQLEANGCGAEGKLAFNGTDKGPIWDVCPAIPDPRAGAIAKDAFLDQVHNNNGTPQNIGLTLNFLSLQLFGVFFNELTPAQQSTVNSASKSASTSTTAANNQ
jgi:hypothetical protein